VTGETYATAWADARRMEDLGLAAETAEALESCWSLIEGAEVPEQDDRWTDVAVARCKVCYALEEREEAQRWLAFVRARVDEGSSPEHRARLLLVEASDVAHDLPGEAATLRARAIEKQSQNSPDPGTNSDPVQELLKPHRWVLAGHTSPKPPQWGVESRRVVPEVDEGQTRAALLQAAW